MEEPNITLSNQPSEVKARISGTSSPQQEIRCPSCSGGNPPVAQNCMWCGQSLRNPGAATANLNTYQTPAAPYSSWDPNSNQQVQPYQSGAHQPPQTVVYNGQGSGYAPPTALAPTQPIYRNVPQAPNQQYQHPQQNPYPGYYPHPPVVIHNTQTVIVANQKSVGLAVFLAFILGPLGMLYSTIWGGIIIFILNVILIPTTLGTGIGITWIAGMIWAGIAASNYNNNAVTAYQQSTTYPPAYRP